MNIVQVEMEAPKCNRLTSLMAVATVGLALMVILVGPLPYAPTSAAAAAAAASPRPAVVRSRPLRNLAALANTSCEKSTLDACMTILMVFGRRDVYLPKNDQEMAPHCQEEYDAEACVKNYARKCLTGFERQVAGMFTLGAGQVLRKRCAADGTREYLSHYTCIKKTIPAMHDAMDQLIYTLMSINEQQDSDMKIPSSCCSFARFLDMTNRIVRLGCQDFDPSAEQYISVKMIRGYVGDILELSCQGYESVRADKCSRVKLPPGGFEWRNTSLVKLADNRFAQAGRPNSVVQPILNIFTNL